MTHPALLVFAKKPDLLADHVEAYSDLIATSLKAMLSTWRRRIVFEAAMIFCIFLSAIFTGVAAMLWGANGGVVTHVAWLLLAVPAAPLVLAIVLWLLASKLSYGAHELDAIKAQVRADLALLREQQS